MAKENSEVVENRLRELRARDRLTQAALASMVNVSRQTIVAIEKGEYNPSVLLALKISTVLREPVEAVFMLKNGFLPDT